MHLFTRFLLAELLKVFVTALLALTLFMVLIGLAKEALRAGLDPLSTLWLIPYLLPNSLVFAIPGTLLLAVSMVYGRLSANNEIVAIKSLGIGPMTLVWPALALGVVLSFATVCLYELGAVWGYYGARRVVLHALDDVIYSTLSTQRSISTQDFSIHVRDVRGRDLIRPIISHASAGQLSDVTIEAERAELRLDETAGTLTVVCRNGSAVTASGESLRFFDEIECQVVLSRFDKPEPDGGPPQHLPLWRISGEVAEQTELIASQPDAAPQVKEQLEDRLHRLKTEPPRRWSTGFTCLAFVCAGVPMAIRLRHRDFLSSFFACFLPILVIYYPLMMVGLDQAKAGTIPPQAVWLSNLVLFAWGGWLLRRVLRH